MKAQCPNCDAVYQIDDSKIPDKGASVKCKKCETRFQIKKEGQPQPKAEKPNAALAGSGESPAEIITCPECGRVNIGIEKCSGCGKTFTDNEKQELAIKI